MEGNQKKPSGYFTSLVLIGFAVLVLAQIMQIGNGATNELKLILLAVVIVSTAAGILAFQFPFAQISEKGVWLVLVLGVVMQIGELIVTQPTAYIATEFVDRRWQFQALISLAGICALISICPENWISHIIRRGLILLVFGFMLIAGIWVIKSSPNPPIDVFMFHQTSASALLHHINPYELSGPNIYGDLRYYGPELVKDGRMTIGNPYPPLSIYLSSLGYFVAGDVRFSHLVAILIAAALIGTFTRNRVSLIASYLLLFSPRLFFIIEQGWTEPLVILLFALLLWITIHYPKYRFIALGLLFASKQYLLIMIPLAYFLLDGATKPRNWIKPAITTVAIATFVTVPLAILNFQRFIWDVGLAQFYQPFRYDSLSYLVPIAQATGKIPSQYISFGILLLAFLFVFTRSKHTPSSFATAMAFCLLLFFAFSKQSFANYYFLVIGMMASAMAALPLKSSLSSKPVSELNPELQC